MFYKYHLNRIDILLKKFRISAIKEIIILQEANLTSTNIKLYLWYNNNDNNS